MLRYFAYDGNGQILSRRDGWLEQGAFVQGQKEGATPLPNRFTHLISDAQWTGLKEIHTLTHPAKATRQARVDSDETPATAADLMAALAAESEEDDAP